MESANTPARRRFYFVLVNWPFTEVIPRQLDLKWSRRNSLVDLTTSLCQVHDGAYEHKPAVQNHCKQVLAGADSHDAVAVAGSMRTTLHCGDDGGVGHVRARSPHRSMTMIGMVAAAIILFVHMMGKPGRAAKRHVAWSESGRRAVCAERALARSESERRAARAVAVKH